MAHWFHRNPLKATVPQTFDSLRAAAKTSDANKTLTYVVIRFVAVLPWTSLHMFLPLSCQQRLETVQGKAVDFAEKSREICGRSVGRSGALLVTFTRINRASCRSDGKRPNPKRRERKKVQVLRQHRVEKANCESFFSSNGLTLYLGKRPGLFNKSVNAMTNGTVV